MHHFTSVSWTHIEEHSVVLATSNTELSDAADLAGTVACIDGTPYVVYLAVPAGKPIRPGAALMMRVGRPS
jgi:hypothetical protein